MAGGISVAGNAALAFAARFGGAARAVWAGTFVLGLASATFATGSAGRKFAARFGAVARAAGAGTFALAGAGRFVTGLRKKNLLSVEPPETTAAVHRTKCFQAADAKLQHRVYASRN
jgi:hypothetical protein